MYPLMIFLTLSFGALYAPPIKESLLFPNILSAVEQYKDQTKIELARDIEKKFKEFLQDFGQSGQETQTYYYEFPFKIKLLPGSHVFKEGIVEELYFIKNPKEFRLYQAKNDPLAYNYIKFKYRLEIDDTGRLVITFWRKHKSEPKQLEVESESLY